MANSNGISLSKVDLLTGTNYHIWELKLSAILRSRKLFKPVIEDPEPDDVGETGSEEAKIRATWEEKNDEAFGIIIITLSEEQAGLFIGQRSAKYVWNELKRIHTGNIEDRKIDIALELKNIRMGGNETVDCYITRARSIATKSAALGQVIPIREVVYHVVRGLHPKMENVALVLRPQRAATLEDVQQALREEETRQNQRSGSNNMNNHLKPERAFKAKDNCGGYANRSSDKKCYVCSKPGHFAKDCWHRQTSNQTENKSKHENTKRRENQHYRNGRGGRGKEHASLAKGFKSEHAWNASPLVRKSQNCSTEENPDIEMWTLDSGCTAHMTPRMDWMVDIQPFDSEVNLAEEGRSIESKAKGNIKLTTTTNNGEEKNISVNDVLYVPKLRTNLLSVRSLIQKGNEVLFDSNGAHIFNSQNELIGEAIENNRMYVLKTKLRSNDIYGDCLATDSATPKMLTTSNHNKMDSGNENEENLDKILWHKRLGHLNDEYMEKMKRNDMVRGLQFKSNKLDLCEPCILGKMAQTSFKKTEQEPTSKPLELIHMDLCGPLPQKSLGGALYMYVLVDSYSRRLFVYFLNSKDETFECFVEFKNQRENELGCKIKKVRSDNGTEFVNRKFEEYFKSEGIHHQRTVPYTPQSNGVAERANRTLLDKARTMLIDAELPITFWAEAVATAAYLKNCTPTKNSGSKTPMELWNGKIPTVSHLKVFGSVIYYHIPKVQRNKLQPKAEKGIFVGYSRKRKAYRVYNPIKAEINEVRTAKFDENSKGVNLLNNNDFPEYNIKELEYSTDVLQNVNEDELVLAPPSMEENEELPNEHTEQERRRRGRKPGDTIEMINARHEIQKMEREQRLSEEGVRRSERIRNQAVISIEKENPNPRTYNEAMKSVHSENWKTAMEDEIQSLEVHKVWKLTPRTEQMKVIKSKWVFSTKENPDGTVDKRKARLVAVGCNQRSRTKHINRKYHFIRDEVTNGNIQIQFVRSESMEADILTKSLNGNLLHSSIKKLGIKTQ